MTTLATMLGLHIRVGTEDTFWRAPHRDELISGNLEMFNTARTIAEHLGRGVATADEYRSAIGLKRRAA
jgi:3-keto-5-aminohexanoate cleavage enzyme